MSSIYKVSHAAIQTFKCCYCQHFLSVPPIYVAAGEKEVYRCGRCEKVKCNSSVFTRIRLFEEVAQHQNFPCSYDECNKIIPWGRVAEHEKNCTHRTIKCPIYYHNCSQIVRVDNLPQHFDEKHKKTVKTVGESWEVTLDCDYVFFLQQGGESFLVYILHLDEVFSIAVLAIKNTKYTTFNVKLMPSRESKYNVCFNDCPVVRYDERLHCYMCFRKKCSQAHHLFSTKNQLGEINVKSFATELEKDLVNSVKSSVNVLRYELTLVPNDTVTIEQDFFPEVENATGDEEGTGELKCHVSMQIPRQFNVEALKKNLTCPYCMTYMAAPIFTCLTGHSICNVCRPRVEKCPTCADPFGNTRNYALEDMTREVGVPCQFDVSGCTFIGNAAKMYIHEQECSFSTFLRE